MRALLGIIFIFVIQVTSKEIIVKPLLSLLPISESVKLTIQFSIGFLVIFASYVIFVRYYEKRELTELSRDNMRKEIAVGIISSIFLITIVFVTLFIMGYYSITSFNMNFSFFEVFAFILALALIEELMFRGFLYRLTEESIGTNLAILISALIFGMVHITNDNVNVITIISPTFGGLLLSVMYSYRQCLWLPISFHAFWNYSQIIYGSKVTGDDYGTFAEAKFEGPELFIGKEFGIENSILVLLVVLIPTIILYVDLSRKNLLKLPYWKKSNTIE